MSGVRLDKVVELVGRGTVINGATLSSFIDVSVSCFHLVVLHMKGLILFSLFFFAHEVAISRSLRQQKTE